MHYRKELSVLVIYIMIFSGLIGFIAIEPEEARAVRVLKVGGTGSGNYSSISSALQAASSGDTVFVYSGIYKETFTMKKNVDIIGEDVENTIIDAGDTWIAVSGANTAVIKGFTIKNFRSFGISIVSTIYLTVDNVIMICDSLKYDPGGINIENSKATILNSNIFAPNKASTGILTDKSTGNNVIVKNTIINGKFNQGFYVQAGASTSSYNNINLTYYPDRCWYGGAQKGTGDISKDPRFVNTNIDELNLSLKGSSPCIDAGDPADTVPDGGGDRVDIGAIEFKLDPMKLPGAPKDLEVSAADTKVKLKWSPPVKDGGSPVEYYRIYRGSSPDELELHNELENVTSYSDTTVTNDETYYYRMTALNTIGEGDSTGIVNVTPYEIIILDPPRIVYIETPKSVNRTESALIRIGVIFNGPISELLMSVLYKSPLDTTWKSDYLSTMEYVNGYWVCIFTPPKNARLGHFNFNFSASAYMDEYSYYPDLYQIEVKNNIPEEAEFTIWPKEPRTTDALRVEVLRIVDVETEPTKLILDYEWFKNGQSVPEYNGLSILPEAATKKGQTWSCTLTVFDGDNLSRPSYKKVKIQNSAPVVENEFYSFEYLEDTPQYLEGKLHWIFQDPDSDVLTFSEQSSENLAVSIYQDNGTIVFTPKKNWYGTELVTFFASDSFFEVNMTVELNIIPVNDLPEVLRIGEHYIENPENGLEYIVYEKQWFNLSFEIIDGDSGSFKFEIEVSLNVTERENLYMNPFKHMLVFYPENDDVGWHYLTVLITDRFHTPIEYVKVPLRIYVINVNDPPQVTIIEPSRFQKYNESDEIILKCAGFDKDLQVKCVNEELEYRWYLTKPIESELGEGDTQILNGLTSGTYAIKVEVTDSTGSKSTDSVMFTVIEQSTSTPAQKTETNENFTQIWSIVIIAVLILIPALFAYTNYGPGKRNNRKKKKLRQVSPTPVGTVLSQQSNANPTGSMMPLPFPRPVQLKTEEPKPESRLSVLKKLELLEERFLHGDISVDDYRGFKAKYEKEAARMGMHPEVLRAIPLEDEECYQGVRGEQ